MVLTNNFIKLEYDPGTDVLFVEWPNVHDYSKVEVTFILDEIVETVKNYDIKNLLTDTRHSHVTLSDHEYAGILNQLAINLTTTRLQKFARLSGSIPNREKLAYEAAALVKDTIQYKSFDDRDSALAWLRSPGA